MLKHLLVLTCALLASSSALAQVMARDLGDFELRAGHQSDPAAWPRAWSPRASPAVSTAAST